MRLWLFICFICIYHFSYAATANSTLPDFDPSGAVVEWTGKIIRQYRSGDDTCFELQRHAANPDKFKTCVYGYYDPAQFGAGNWLKVMGTLQPEHADALPLVLGAQVSLTSAPLPRRYYRDPWYNPHYDPFYDPFFSPYPLHYW
ncbi:MAG: hypothetical protein P4L77_08620 [Sulfuriferula sp.]|nr:hypothetical protein [Sulfuriferula sp.]